VSGLRRACIVSVALVIVACSGPVYALTAGDVSALVLLEWRKAGDMLVDEARWFGDHKTLALGGWQQHPDKFAVAIYPGPSGQLHLCPDAVSPHCAVSLDGQRLTYWRRVPMEQGAAAELSVLDVSGPLISTVGAPRRINSAMHLAWLSDFLVLFTLQRDDVVGGTLFVSDLRGGAPVEVLKVENGFWHSLRNTAAGDVIAEVATGLGPALHKVTTTPSGPIQVAQISRPSSIEPVSFELDREGQLIYNQSDTEGLIIDDGVTGFSQSPDRHAIIYTKPHQIMAIAVGKKRPRCVKRLPPNSPSLIGCSWSPGTSNVCVWGKQAATGKVWYGLLGTERVTGRFRFPPDAEVSTGGRIWVATRFYLDERGTVKEPDWKTLKACFVITRVLRGTDRIIAEADNAGDEGGVVARLAGSDNPAHIEDSGSHIRIGTGPEPPTQWMQSFRAAPVGELGAWLQDTTHIGDLVSIGVQRDVLLPVGPSPRGPQP